ncbi:MAG: BNR-4 repeat-containing protein, partial [Candidatus Thorarchaeota archaeon]
MAVARGKPRITLIAVAFLLIVGVFMTPVDMPASEYNTAVSEPVKVDTGVLSLTLGVEIGSDMDDDWWKYEKPSGPWHHYTNSADNLVRNNTEYDAYGQMRFQLNIPQGATIESATFSFYLINAGGGTITIRRIDETNVGPLEQDTTMPIVTSLYSSFIEPGSVENVSVESDSLALMVQDQVNLPGWQSGYYFGVQMTSDTSFPTSFADYEYQDAQFVAYMNITYLTDEVPTPQAQDYDHDLHIPIQSDSDDDWWRWNKTTESWEHRIGGTEVVAGNSTASHDYGQMRFSLKMPQGCTVNFATLNLYLTYNGNVTIFIKRIDEMNLGSLEDDIEKPNTTDVHMSTLYAGTQTGWITSNNLADMIQDQIDLDGWEEDYYIGLQLVVITPDTAQTASWYDYQHASGSPAYLNVTFTSTEVGWLSDWQYRKKIVLQQATGVGVNQTIPISLWQGQGGDGGFEAHLNGHARPDFGDVRFTSDDGQLLLRYYMNETVSGTSSEYFTNDAVALPWGQTNTPSSFYDADTDRTYVSFQGDLTPGGVKLDPHICYYDHKTATWSGIYWIATNPLNDWYGGDTHGSPCIWVDNDGYIHVLYGSHASRVIQHEKSDRPNDITSFSPSTDPTTSTWEPTYPAIHYDSVSDTVHIFYRGSTGGRYLVYQYSTNNGNSWSSPQPFVYMGTTQGEHNRPYHGFSAFDEDGIIHVAFQNHSMYPAAQAGADHDMFYIQLDTSNGHVYNVNGYDFGTQADPTELQNCRFYIYPYEGGTRSGYPDVFLDDEGNPWIFYFVGNTEILPNPSSYTLKYSYWNGASWESDDISAHEGSGCSAAALVRAHDDITIFTNSNPSNNLVHRWTWDGFVWTDNGPISVQHDYLVSNSQIPTNWFDGNRTELQVVFCEYEGSNPPFDKCRGFAWGDGGIVAKSEQTMAMFNVEVVGNLSSSSQTIYVYYGNIAATSVSQVLGIDSEPRLNLLYWGPEVTFDIDAPLNVQEPMISNIDDGSYMYARAKAYQIEVVLSDIDGFADIDYAELSLFSDNRITEYWTIRYDQATNSFSEQRDLFGYIELDEAISSAVGLGITLTLTFDVKVNWNHPDVTRTDVKCYSVDDTSQIDTDYYETDWDIETRLDLSSEPMLADGIGTPDRGDPNSDVIASGNIVYLGGDSHPSASEIDVYISCPEVSMTAWEATNYDEASGLFSAITQSDDEIGQDIYTFIVVRQGEGAQGFDLLDEQHSASYITDRVQVIISIDEAASTDEYVTIRLDLEYEYDHESITSFSVGVDKNGELWQVANQSTLIDTRNMDQNNTYSIAFVVENTHGLSTSNEYGSVVALAGDGGASNPGNSNPALNPPGSLNDVIRIALQIVSIMMVAGFAFLDGTADMLDTLFTQVSPSGFMMIAIVSSILSFTAFQIHGRRSARRNGRWNESFRRLGGLKVDTLLLAKSLGGGLVVKMGEKEFSCKVLMHDYMKAKERIQAFLAVGGRTNQLLRLLS